MEKHTDLLEVWLTSDGLVQAKRKDGKPLSRKEEEEAKVLILPYLPLVTFARWKRSVAVWSDLLDEPVWFCSGKAQVRALILHEIPRRLIYTARELLDLFQLTYGGNYNPTVTEAKNWFCSDQKPIRSDKPVC